MEVCGKTSGEYGITVRPRVRLGSIALRLQVSRPATVSAKGGFCGIMTNRALAQRVRSGTSGLSRSYPDSTDFTTTPRAILLA